jgi:hypothetical protein
VGEVIGWQEGDDFGDVAPEVIADLSDLIAKKFGLLAFLMDFVLAQGEALLVEGEAAGVEPGTVQGDEVGGEAVETAEFGFGFFGLGQRIGGGGEAEEEPMEEVVEDLEMGWRLRGGGIGAGVFGDGERELEGVLVEFPVPEAVPGPVVEVLFGDDFGVEVFGEDGVDLRESVEPVKDGLVGFGVVEAAIDLVAE